MGNWAADTNYCAGGDRMTWWFRLFGGLIITVIMRVMRLGKFLAATSRMWFRWVVDHMLVEDEREG